ncbi:TIGR03943 family protein [Kitasatospora sp. MAP5-34]|uniref:TIGR03943 family putative permease subunit n=1 Tax=Kitasatospora sp. MAP5-34 TaxID=3035102 RepID=UPI002475BB66|nr:TIGR03943 family protein [Kitasatospora sp. MAP5-34]MDH6576334.1 putative repeat protein (TIGR03943 family) [Kitasatospora sp. MAP5-34]
MKREVQAILLVLLGAAILRISLFSDTYLRYVREALGPYLIAAGLVLVALGALSAVAALRGSHDEDQDDHQGHEGHGHGEGHSHGPRIAWLLILPVATIFLVSPPALGSYTAQHAASAVAKPDTAARGFPALPAGDPLAMPLAEFDVRALWDTARPLAGRRVKLLGFATPKSGGGWYVTRLVISCCAADAMTYKAEIRGAAAPPAGSWVEVTGVWQPDGQSTQPDAVPALTAAQVVPVPQPRDPYE